MSYKTKLLAIVVLVIFSFDFAQQENKGSAKLLYSKNGFEVNFIFYSEGTGLKNNGVVVILENKNNYKIHYKFDLIIRTPSLEKILTVEGELKAGERKTGSNEGLYFVPFNNKVSISEVGIKNTGVTKIK